MSQIAYVVAIAAERVNELGVSRGGPNLSV
jgi:hypothetical protein